MVDHAHRDGVECDRIVTHFNVRVCNALVHQPAADTASSPVLEAAPVVPRVHPTMRPMPATMTRHATQLSPAIPPHPGTGCQAGDGGCGNVGADGPAR